MPQAPHLLPGLDDPAPKTFRDGTHRLIAPEQTIQRARIFAPVMGITRVANVTGLDVIGIPVVMVTRPNARSLAVSQGKGLTLAAAKASGLMESIESYHAETITLPLKLLSYEALRYTHNSVDPQRLPLVAGGRWSPRLRTLWIEGFDIAAGENIWLPYELAHTDYTLPLPSGSGAFQMSSNGLASGNHLLEAVSHGICELVERDAISLFTLLPQAEQAARRVDLATVDDFGCRAALAKFEAAGVIVGVWDVTSDIRLPAYQCMIADRDENAMRRLYSAGGYGCHPVRGVALLRALTEAAQSRLTLISGARDDLPREQYERHRGADLIAGQRAQILNTQPTRSFYTAPTYEGETCEDDLRHALGCLAAAGLEQVIVIDLTQPAFKLPVVRVVIPGIEGIHSAVGYTWGQRAQSVLSRHLQN